MADNLDPDEPCLTYRVYIDGKLVREDLVTVGEADRSDALGIEHRQIADTADAEGKAWLMEIELHGRPEDQRFVRFGTDAHGIVDPREVVSPDALREIIMRRMFGG